MPLKPIYIFTPHWIRTGGPEAQHQLSDALIEQGFDARLVYYNPDDISGVGEENGRIVPWLGIPKLFPDHKVPSFEDYARYKTNPARSLNCSEGCVIVLSETLAHLTPLFPPSVTVLIWWLSVDNGFGALSQVNINHLRKANVKHAYQSEYAQRFGDVMGFVSAGMLSDYTVDLTEHATPLAWSERPKLAALNLRRSIAPEAEIADAIRALDPEIECVVIRDMSRAELAQILARARVYVDLGSFPGKDRGPREATTMGCCALVAHAGAAPETGAFMCGGQSASSVAVSVKMLMTGEPQFFAAPEREIFNAEVRAVFNAL